MPSQPKLRIFAGPNGSGKTTLYESIRSVYFSTRLFVNADLIESDFRKKHYLDFSEFNIKTTDLDFQQYIRANGLYHKAGFTEDTWNISIKENVAVQASTSIQTNYNSYHFAIVADFIRFMLIQSQVSFSFETVFSHPSKLQIIDMARKSGYKIYLYFIGTESPLMNIERVNDRIMKGGHPVSAGKIHDRYYRTMGLLLDMLKQVDEAYLWDNSGQRHEYIGWYKKDTISFKKTLVPEWVFTYIIDKIA